MITEFTALNDLLIFVFCSLFSIGKFTGFMNFRNQSIRLHRLAQHNPKGQPKPLVFWLTMLFGLCFPLDFANAQATSSALENKNFQHADLRGVPSIIHYNRNDFSADPQFWTMCEDGEGILYFGNNDGALVYDGENWQKVTLPNGSSVRSLLYSKDGEIYAGGFNEFGKIKQDSFGVYYFESMLPILGNETHNFENVWDILEGQQSILFRTFKMLIAVENQKATILPADEAFTFSRVIGDKLYVEDKGLLKHLDLQNLQYQIVFEKAQIRNEDLVAMLEHRDDQLLAVTKQGSLFIYSMDSGKITWKEDIIPKNSNNLVTCALKSKEGFYFLGTLSTKTLILDSNAETLGVIQAFDQLQDQTVLNIFESSQGNIWAMLNNGLDCIDLSSPVTSVFDGASVYDIKLAHNKVFLATNQGVYFSEPSKEPSFYSALKFTKVKGMEGQAWAIHLYEDQVLASHDKGVYVFRPDGSTYALSGISGIWKIIPIQGNPNHYLACGYDGMYLIKFQGNLDRFEYVQKIEGFGESSRDILQSEDPHVFWVCHGYKGVYRVRLNQDFTRVIGLEHFRDQNGLPSPYSINVFKYGEQTVFTTNHGIYTYDESDNTFLPFDTLNTVFGIEKNVRNLQKVGHRLWFVHDDEAGYVDLVQGKPGKELNKDLFMALKGEFNRSMECILPIDETLVLMGTRTGLFAFDLAYDKDGKKQKVIFRKVAYTQGQDEIEAPVVHDDYKPLQIPHDASNIRIGFAVPGFKDSRQVQYSYLLEGQSKDWSPWTVRSSVELNYLKPGDYRLLVKARSRIGEASDISSYALTVLPHWYQTSFALAAFILLSFLLVFLLFMAVQRKIKTEREKALIDQAEKTKVLELELQQMKLENEKRKIEKDKEILEEDVVHKSKELANYTMLLVKKKELLNELNDQLKDIRKAAISEREKSKLRALERRIQSNLSDEEHLQMFDANFERVHQAFFQELKSAYPNLSIKELRLCAFVKMNLTNKEIASILNISVRGVETARYRLRKRLSLDHAVNMVEFLDSLSASELEGEDRDIG